jgi:PKD repeat protein
MEPANEKSQRKVLVFIVYTLIIILTLISSMMLFYPRFPLHKWPHAVFVYSPIMPIIYENVTFDASHSFDPDGWIMRYRWDFGDGIVSVENRSIVNHVFSEFGIRKVTLTVTDNNNLTDSISDTLTVRKLPIARFVYSPVILYVGDEVLFDASASTPEGGYIVSYNWDFGDGGTTLTRESCVTHVYPRSGTYEVTLTITDSEELRDEKSKTLMVVKGAVIDIYTKYPSPFGGQGLGNPSDGFSPQDHVILYANVTFNKIPVEDEFVVFEVRDPSSTIFIYRTAVTNSFGVAALSFTIPWYGNITEVISGMWSTFASVEVLGEKVNDTLTFPVHWLVELVGLETCDYDGDAKASFMKGESIYFQVHLRNIALVRKNVTITISIYDELNVPVGSSVLEYFIVPPRSYTIFITDLQVSKRAFIGNATAHVSAFSRLPVECGIPYCPEISDVFVITRHP